MKINYSSSTPPTYICELDLPAFFYVIAINLSLSCFSQFFFYLFYFYFFTFIYLFISNFFFVSLFHSGFKFCHQEQSYNPDRQSLAQTISRCKDIDPSTGSNTSGQVSQSNNVINLKSTQVDSSNLTLPQSQAWNLPMRNSFTSYSKPLSKVPKGVFS